MRQRLDLWPSGIEVERISAPLIILREQAALLGERTKNLVQAEVIEEESRRDRFIFYFFLLAPVLGNYRYQLLTVSHDIDLYPVEITVEDSILHEVSEKLDVRIHDSQGNYRQGDEPQYIHAESEEAFIKALRIIFNTSKSRRVLTALISQSDPTWTGVLVMANGTTEIEDEDIPF